MSFRKSESSFPTTFYSFNSCVGALSYIYCAVKKASDPPHPTIHIPDPQSKNAEVSKPCVSPFAWRVTYQTIPGFSTTGPGNNGEPSMEAAALCVQSPMDTSPAFKKKRPSIRLYITEVNVLIAAIFSPLCVNKRDL